MIGLARERTSYTQDTTGSNHRFTIGKNNDVQDKLIIVQSKYPDSGSVSLHF